MRASILLLALALSTASSPVSAQSNTVDEVDLGDGRDNDIDSRLGLLGLLGLAGLFGLKRREPDIHVDARRDKRG